VWCCITMKKKKTEKTHRDSDTSICEVWSALVSRNSAPVQTTVLNSLVHTNTEPKCLHETEIHANVQIKVTSSLIGWVAVHVDLKRYVSISWCVMLRLLHCVVFALIGQADNDVLMCWCVRAWMTCA
jgi:hypothetical protein